MEKYLTIVSRDQFINLYRFGNLNIHNNFIISEEYVLELLKLLQCEYDEDYLILDIEYIKKHTLDKMDILHNLKIQDVKSVYVLSQKAKNYYEPKFNSKIKFNMYFNLDVLQQAQKYRELDDIESGIKVLSKQFDFICKDKIEEELNKGFKNDALESLKNENYLESDYESFYIDLLSYKRESFFPKNDIGYLFDLIVITVLKNRKPELISKFKQGNLSIDSSKTYQKLNDNDNKALLEYIEFIKNTDDADIKKFLEKTEGVKYLIIGSLFLMIKNILLEKSVKYNEKFHKLVDIFKKDYADELAISLYLIGFVFGYKELYEDYYNDVSLDIFNDKKEDENGNNKNYIEIENQELEGRNEILSKKIIDLENELKTYKEKIEKENEILSSNLESVTEEMNSTIHNAQESTLALEFETTSDNNENVISLFSMDPIITGSVPEENSNADDSKTINEVEKRQDIPCFQLTEEEISIFPLSNLVKIAKLRGVHQPNSKKYKGDEGQRALYKAIICKTSINIIDEDTPE